MFVVQIAGILLFVASTAYLVLAIFRVSRFREHGLSPADPRPVTVMVPCYGAPPPLLACLRSICNQDYPAPLQVVFGLHSGDDPARAVIAVLLADYPDLDATVVVDGRRAGVNPKNCNLANMQAAAKHDWLVVVDSDILVGPSFVAGIVAPLAAPGVGATTCLYKGLADDNIVARLGGLYINDWFLPSALVDLARKEITITYGAATALTRQALDSVGGFATMASAVAQDYVLGHEISRAGYAIRLAPEVVATRVTESGWTALLRREVRWMRAIRAVRPLEHLLWIVTSPLVPLLALAPAWPMMVAGPALLVYLGLRIILHYLVRRHIALPEAEPLLVPLRDIFNFILWTVSFLDRRIHWGRSVMVTGDGLNMHLERPEKSDTMQMERFSRCNIGGMP